MSTEKNQQQAQTLSFFEGYAANWRDKADGLGAFKDKVNVISQRNNVVIQIAKRIGAKTALDIGCGTGELTIDLSLLGVSATGVDFAASMIESAKTKSKSSNAQSAHFECASIFEYDPSSKPLDLISGNGLIEYISYNQLNELLDRIHPWMKKGGHLVMGSRNRLYNLFSLNEFTSIEKDLGSVQNLLDEAMAISGAGSFAECLQALSQMKNKKLPRFESHPKTGGGSGVAVETRHQYTPGELVRVFEDKGYRIRGLYPVHYHAVIPRFARNFPQVHTQISDLMYSFWDSQFELIPYATTFMIHAERE